jgi:hypothetical protein
LKEVINFGEYGLPDKPSDEQKWAINKVREYHYRKLFGLSKAQMAREPLEDVYINEIINNEYYKKDEKKARRERLKHG